MSEQATITVGDDGPYLVEGPCRIVDADGRAWDLPGPKAWLCRCGQSSRKPFCDGTHNTVGFESRVRAGE